MVLIAMMLFQYIYPGESDLIPRDVWQSLLGRLRSELDHPDSNAPFRGSLIDENMFAIDINEWGMANLIDDQRARREHKIPQFQTPAA